MIYEVGVITPVRESNGGRILHGFNVIGVEGRALVTFDYETEEEAAAAREQMREAVARAKSIVPHKAMRDTPRRARASIRWP
jgi:hypothetical protein